MMSRNIFPLERYRENVWGLLQPKKTVSESLQASTFSAEILWKGEIFVSIQPVGE